MTEALRDIAFGVTYDVEVLVHNCPAVLPITLLHELTGMTQD
jgi:hypothetical protein